SRAVTNLRRRRHAAILWGVLAAAAFLAADCRAQTTLPAQLWQRAELVDAQGAVASEPVFRRGDRNILVVHGWRSTPTGVRDLTDYLVGQYANVLVFKYPSGVSIRAAGRLL